jgi:outer membrane protein assembly factor BamB
MTSRLLTTIAALCLLFSAVSFTRAAKTALQAADDDWPRWRGPNENGMARGDAPVEWGEGKNIAWRAPIPGRGQSSPVIWGDKIFITTAVPTEAAAAPTASVPTGPPQAPGPGGTPQKSAVCGDCGAGAGREHKFMALCLNRHTGKVIWERVAKVATPQEGHHVRYGSFASNSPVTDGKRVYAFFGSHGLYAYDLDGKLIWEKQFPPMRVDLQFGEGSAPGLGPYALYLKFDHEEGSYLVAIDKNTGKELWRVNRDENSSWSQPLVVANDGRTEVVVSATNKVRSYDAATGKVIWEAAGLGGGVIPNPVSAGGIVYLMSGAINQNLLAIRLGRDGDLTGSDAILWTNNRGNPFTPSPVLHDNKLYFVTDNGMLSCLDARTGAAYYKQQRLPKPYNFKASPVGASGKLYLAAEDGDVVVVKMGEKYEALATNSLPDQMFIASPAITGGSLYLRSQNSLYCIREAKR